MEDRIIKLEKQIMELQDALIQIVDKMKDMSDKINDIHSKPEPAINRLVMPTVPLPLQTRTKETKSYLPIEEKGVPSNYFFIRDSFPTAEVFYFDVRGNEKVVQVYGDIVYLGGNKAEGIPGKRFKIDELRIKYFGNE